MCCVNAVSRWSCIWVSFTCLGWRHSLDEGVKQWGRLFKAKESDRSSRVNEYAVCCHALFLCPAVVLRRKRGKTLSRSGLAASADTQTPRATNDADYMKHMLFLQHKHTLSHLGVWTLFYEKTQQPLSRKTSPNGQSLLCFSLLCPFIELSCHCLPLWNINQNTDLLITNYLAKRFCSI